MTDNKEIITQVLDRETLQQLVNNIAKSINHADLTALLFHLIELSDTFKRLKSFIGQGKFIATQKSIRDFNVEDAIIFIKHHYSSFHLIDKDDISYRKQGALIQEAFQMHYYSADEEDADRITHFNEIDTALKLFAGITGSDFVSRDLQFTNDEVDALLPLVKKHIAINYQEKKILEGVPNFLRDEFRVILASTFQYETDRYRAISRCLTRQLMLDDAYRALTHYAKFLTPEQGALLRDTWYHFQTHENAGFVVSNHLLNAIETKLESNRQQYIATINDNMSHKAQKELGYITETQVLTTPKDWAAYYTTTKEKALKSRDTYVTYQASRMLIDNILPIISQTSKTTQGMISEETAKSVVQYVPKEQMAKEWVRSIYNTILSRNDWVKLGGEKVIVNGMSIAITHHQKIILDTILMYINHKKGQDFQIKAEHSLGDYPYTKLAKKLQMIGQQAEQSRGLGRLFRTDETSKLYMQVRKGVTSHDNDTGLISREKMDSQSDVSASTYDIRASFVKG